MKDLWNKYLELRKDKKGKEFIKLISYLVFIFVFLLLVLITGSYKKEKAVVPKTKESVESKVEITYLDKQKKLYEGKYNFVYEITGAITIKYNGTFDKGTTTGFKEDSNGITKYKISEGNVYSIKMDTEEPYDKLYDGLDISLFDFKSLFEDLNTRNTTINDEKDKKSYSYKDVNGYDVSVVLDDNYIKEIVITNDSLKYDFSFNY